MDIVQIILIIAGCIAGLFILWAIIAAIFAFSAKKSFDKQTDKMYRRFDSFDRF